MLEIRFHGRGGQGALTAARILATAFWKETNYPLALPEFKSERRGAPISMGLRVDERQILLRSKIYAPSCLVILDSSLIPMKQAGVLHGFQKENGVVIINAKSQKNLEIFSGCKIGIVDVDAISQKYGLGPESLPIIGTAILGAFAKATSFLKLESILEAAKDSDELPKKEENVKAIKEVFEATQVVELAPNDLKAEFPGQNGNGNGLAELPLSVISLGDTRSNLTGSWRKIRPYYENKISPCTDACPLENDIPYWISLLKQGKTREAWERLVEKNPLPASVARICQGFCEAQCNRKEFDQALSIRNLEKFLGDTALKEGWKTQITALMNPFKIAVVGAGPAGLSCAFQLARKGFQVRIFEQSPVAGGLLRLGIPKHRLAKDIVEQEIQNNILSLGQDLLTNIKIGDRTRFEILEKNFDAVFVAIGLWQSRKLSIPGADNPKVIPALDFLKRANLGEKFDIGKTVLVVGAGNTGIDSARVAKTLGAGEVLAIELQKEENVLVAAEEKEAARREGIEICYELKLLAINLLLPDERLEVVCQKGEVEWVVRRVDTIITAIGQDPEISFFAGEKKLFIGGDARNQAGNVAAAIGSGRKAAENIARMLLGQPVPQETKSAKVELSDINLAYFKHQKRKIFPLFEAERCFSCGVCDLCGNCWKFCPHMSVFEKNGKLEINYDYCKGCGICAEECPRAVISQRKEE